MTLPAGAGERERERERERKQREAARRRQNKHMWSPLAAKGSPARAATRLSEHPGARSLGCGPAARRQPVAVPRLAARRRGRQGRRRLAVAGSGLRADHRQRAQRGPALNTIWRNQDDCLGVLLFVTPAGRRALGIEATAPRAGRGGGGRPRAERWRRSGQGGASAQLGEFLRRKLRDGTKQAQSIAMLKRPEGATISDRRGDRLAAAHGARCLRRRAEEAARADRHLREGRGNAGQPHRRLT